MPKKAGFSLLYQTPYSTSIEFPADPDILVCLISADAFMIPSVSVIRNDVPACVIPVDVFFRTTDENRVANSFKSFPFWRYRSVCDCM